MAHSFVDSISDVDVISDAEVSKLTFLIPLILYQYHVFKCTSTRIQLVKLLVFLVNSVVGMTTKYFSMPYLIQ